MFYIITILLELFIIIFQRIISACKLRYIFIINYLCICLSVISKFLAQDNNFPAF